MYKLDYIITDEKGNDNGYFLDGLTKKDTKELVKEMNEATDKAQKEDKIYHSFSISCY